MLSEIMADRSFHVLVGVGINSARHSIYLPATTFLPSAIVIFVKNV
jgi:hypothetical protein